MGELNKQEMLIRYGALGFVPGVLVTVLVYLILFQAQQVDFTFRSFSLFHQEFRYLFGIDLVPAASLLLGASLGSWRYAQMAALNAKIRSEKEKNDEISRFVHALIAGELKTSFSFPDMDPTLSDSLNQLQETLLRNREIENQRRVEERQRNWVSEGLAEFGDILRTRSDDLEEMAYAVISKLVRHLDANQGALFLAMEENGEKKLRMIACHAYERRKFPGKEVAWGDGLIGAVAMERKGYYTERIPDGYLTITSGLGKANPTHLLIEPLIWNDQVFGIIEIASFRKMDSHVQQFVTRVSENIATTISTIGNNQRTKQLLRETQAQAEKLSQQEEKVRQNMEALTRTQEEAARQADQFISFTNTVNHTLLRAEYAIDGTLLYANTLFLRKMGYRGNREVEGRHISAFIHEKDRAWFDSLWNKLARGGRHFEGYMKHETKMGQDLWTMATYTGMRKESGEVEKILFLAIDTTEQKKESLESEGQIAAIDRLNAKVVFTPSGKLESANQLFITTIKHAESELQQMNVFDFIAPSEQERFSEIWEGVIRGEPFQGQLKMRSKFEEEVWFRATFLSVNDMYGELEQVIFLASEITREKEMETASRNQYEQLVKKEEDMRMEGMELKRKLEESNRKRKEQLETHRQEILRYTRIMDGLPYPVFTVNNLGFLLYLNKTASRFLKVKTKNALGSRALELFHEKSNPDALLSVVDPSRASSPGTFRDQELILADGTTHRGDMLVIQSDYRQEVHSTLVIF